MAVAGSAGCLASYTDVEIVAAIVELVGEFGVSILT